jgi:tol-pal system protein YbgF
VLRCFVMVSCSVRALFYGVAAALLTGCASGSGTPPPNEQAVAAPAPAPAPPRVTLNDVKSTQDAQAQEIARLGAELKAQDAQQSFLVAELKSLSEQVTKLKASLDEAEGAVRALRATPVAPETRPAAPPAPPPGSAPAIVTSPPPPTVSALPAPVTSPPPPTVSAPPAPVSPGPRNVEAERMFAAALTQLRSGNDGQAALQFTEFVTQYPSHPQAAAAQNYIGEAFYRQRDFRQAVAEFQKTVDNYTQATPVSEALLKIGLCQRALGDAAAAKAAWEQVIKQFPKTDAARQARTLLAAKPGGPR